MKIFNRTDTWLEKVNFVDKNNCLIGYDLTQSCCETADWFISDSKQSEPQSRTETPTELPDWEFDPTFIEFVRPGGDSYSPLDEGGMVIFRLVNNSAEKFLHLYNCHNGYYSHGFTFTSSNEVLHKGHI